MHYRCNCSWSTTRSRRSERLLRRRERKRAPKFRLISHKNGYQNRSKKLDPFVIIDIEFKFVKWTRFWNGHDIKWNRNLIRRTDLRLRVLRPRIGCQCEPTNIENKLGCFVKNENCFLSHK